MDVRAKGREMRILFLSLPSVSSSWTLLHVTYCVGTKMRKIWVLPTENHHLGQHSLVRTVSCTCQEYNLSRLWPLPCLEGEVGEVIYWCIHWKVSGCSSSDSNSLGICPLPSCLISALCRLHFFFFNDQAFSQSFSCLKTTTDINIVVFLHSFLFLLSYNSGIFVFVLTLELCFLIFKFW